jgi:hypothetical protein
MSNQDEEKNDETARVEEEWPNRDRDVIVRLSERFEVFTAQVIKKMDELLSMRDMVEKLLHRQTSKRSTDAERKRKERCGIAKHKRSGALELAGNIFDTKMVRMHKKYILWAHVGTQFGIMGSYGKFLAWLASDWNHWTFDKKPITRVSNRPHLFCRGVRNEATWTDVFGRETGIREATFFEPMFWEFQHIMVKVVKMMEEMPDWANIHDSFRAHLQVSCSGLADTTASGMYKFQDKAPFDHLEQACSKVPQYRIMATRVMQSFRAGITKKSTADPENDLELVRMGRARAAEHLALLQNQASKLTFLWNLRKGVLKQEEQQEVDALDVWGFTPQFPSLVKTPSSAVFIEL